MSLAKALHYANAFGSSKSNIGGSTTSNTIRTSIQVQTSAPSLVPKSTATPLNDLNESTQDHDCTLDQSHSPLDAEQSSVDAENDDTNLKTNLNADLKGSQQQHVQQEVLTKQSAPHGLRNVPTNTCANLTPQIANFQQMHLHIINGIAR